MHVFLTEDAISDLDDIWDFAARSSQKSATRLIDQLVERALELGENPNAAPLMANSPAGARRVNVRSWAIIYRVTTQQVEVLSFLQGKNDPARFR